MTALFSQSAKNDHKLFVVDGSKLVQHLFCWEHFAAQLCSAASLSLPVWSGALSRHLWLFTALPAPPPPPPSFSHGLSLVIYLVALWLIWWTALFALIISICKHGWKSIRTWDRPPSTLHPGLPHPRKRRKKRRAVCAMHRIYMI